MSYEQQFLTALATTLAVELIVLFLITRIWFKINGKKLSNKLLLFSGIITSSLTLPYLWFVLPSAFNSYLQLLVVGEISVTVVEAIVYKAVLKLDWKKALLTSIACNLSSFLIGLIFKI